MKSEIERKWTQKEKERERERQEERERKRDREEEGDRKTKRVDEYGYVNNETMNEEKSF